MWCITLNVNTKKELMVDTSLLKTQINKSGFRTSYIAKSLDITKQAFYNKLNNRTDFTVDQAFKIKRILNLDSTTFRNIFFAKDIALNVIKGEALDEI